MKEYRSLTIWVLITSFLPTLYGGHGVAPLLLLEVMSLIWLVTLNADMSIFFLPIAVAILSQIGLLVTLFRPTAKNKYLKFFSLIGLLLLCAIYWLLSRDRDLDLIWSSIVPVFVLSSILLVLHMKSYNQKPVSPEEGI